VSGNGAVEERQAIRELVEAYNDAVMRFDGTAWSRTWAEESSWSLPGRELERGRIAILKAWNEIMTAFEFVGFFASPGPIIIEGNKARGRWWQLEILIRKDRSRVTVIGSYADEYVRIDGQWLFASRTYRIFDMRAEAAPPAMENSSR